MKLSAPPRVVAVVGPQGVAKNAFWESLMQLARTDAAPPQPRPGTPEENGSAEALSVVTAEFQGGQWTFIDCPSAPESFQETQHALMISDAALVICDAQAAPAGTLAPLLHFLDARRIPHLLFLNALDESGASVRALLKSLQVLSGHPLVLREMPLREGERMVGVVDLVSETTWGMKADREACLIPIPDSQRPIEEAARRQMLERLADQDDELLEALVEDSVPPPETLHEQMARALRDNRLVPVFIGSAERGWGLLRLLEGLRQEAPTVEETRMRLRLTAEGGPLAQCFKTYHLPEEGPQCLMRLWRGPVEDGSTLAGMRIDGMLRPQGATRHSVKTARMGEVMAVGRLDQIRAGDLLEADGVRRPFDWPQ
ncbi:GTP-binding protein [Stigmatella sp. ncwal1]|uniref:GTP-binding protein n=1 Tax=Stigmatella ashevillensis TaxID=2995309 RepID=A0ABT5D6G7_9BACT|nr:GTP-binding protein [Stigmatella ashevillena]MDC0707851.1 GTP-binding protein [Stigmatella ashevillena]